LRNSCAEDPEGRDNDGRGDERFTVGRGAGRELAKLKYTAGLAF
jgi:hypothetical protein